MTVEELIKELEKMPNDARVFHLFDGEPRHAVNLVYECKSGQVITTDFGEMCMSLECRPKYASNDLLKPYTFIEKSDRLIEDDFYYNNRISSNKEYEQHVEIINKIMNK